MWLLRYLFFAVVLGMFAVIVLLFLGQNQRIEQLDFFGLQYTTNLVWVLLGTGGLGFLITLLLLLPGRIGVALHNRSLERELRDLEHDLLRLQEQREHMLARHELLLDTHERVLQSYQRLVAEVGRLTAERDQARTQLAATGTSRVPSVVKARTTSPRLAVVPPGAARAADSVVKSSVASANGKAAVSAVPAQHLAPSPVTHAATNAAREGTSGAERDTGQLSAGEPATAAHVQTAIAATMRSAEAALASEKPPVAVAFAAISAEPAVTAAPMASIEAASAPPVLVAGTPEDHPTLPTRIATNVIIPLAREVATLPDQLRELPDRLRGRVREDIAAASALVASVRAALEARPIRVERASPLSRPSGGAPGADDQS